MHVPQQKSLRPPFTMFANVVNVDGLRIKDGKVFVIWKWQVLHPQDKTVVIIREIAVCFRPTEPRTIQRRV